MRNVVLGLDGLDKGFVDFERAGHFEIYVRLAPRMSSLLR